jgi:nucleoside-diphosphate-sugar epimerase
MIGQAIGGRLLASGWDVDLAGRDRGRMPAGLATAGAGFVAADRHDDAQLRAAVGGGADLLVDCVCYTAADATRLLPLLPDVGSAVMISSKAVYVDARGNHVNSDDPPHFDGPVRESQATVAPSDGDYNTRAGYGANRVAAEHVLLDSGHPVTVLRPSKVHGPASPRPREWMFVRRVLDQRPAVLLAHHGAGVDHTSAAANIAALTQTVAAKPGRRILNSADPDAPSALEISRAIAAYLGHQWEEVLLDDDADPALGAHLWDAAYPIVLDMTAAAELGYTPAGDYAATVAQAVDWLVSAVRGGRDAGRLPGLDDPFFAPLFDYAAEDRYLAGRPSAGD